MKTKAHKRYRLRDETIIPGVTTVCALLAKPALPKWANDLGLQGIDSAKYTDDKADIGTLAHSIITDKLQGLETDYSDYTPNQIIAAESCVVSYYAWEAHHEIKPILIEEPMVSEKDRFGGTLDIYAKVDGVKELIDIKTGSAIWPEFITQVAAYRQLLTEAEHEVKRVRILNIPRSGTENFQELIPSDTVLDMNFEIFTCLLRIYNIRKELK